MNLLNEIFIVSIGVIFVNNFVLQRFLGLCPYMGVSKQMESTLGMGLAVIFVMTMASVVTWAVYGYLLVPYHLEFLTTVAYILVIAAFVQFVEMVIQKVSPSLYLALGIYLPLITTNCAVLGVAVLNTEKFLVGQKPSPENLLLCAVQGFAGGVGFTLAMLLMCGIRERMEFVTVPKFLQGLPIAFVTAALMSMAFMGFSGLVAE